MSPTIEYRASDILVNTLQKRFDVATLMEVLEHIPVERVTCFLDAVGHALSDQGTLILTVPHVNLSVSNKHHQHFTSEALRDLLGARFRDLCFVPFDAKSKAIALLHRLLGGEGKRFVITDSKLLGVFFRLYIRRYLYARDEAHCGRLAAVCKKK